MINQMMPDELKQLMDEKRELLLLDCREQYEWDEVHIPSAKHIPIGEMQLRLDELANYKNKKVVVQCRSGQRSQTIVHLLLANGFVDVSNLAGGILEWIDCGHPVTH